MRIARQVSFLLQANDDVLISEVLSQSLPQTFFIAQIIEEHSLGDPVGQVVDIDGGIR